MQMHRLLAPMVLLIGSAAPAHPHSSGAGTFENFGNCVRTWPRENDVVRGSGRMVRQPRPAAAFTRIVNDGPANLEIQVGPNPAIEVEMDDNLLSNVKTDVRNGRLKIGSEGSYCSSRAPTIRVTVPSLRVVDIGASGDARVSGLNGGELDVTITGSGDVTAAGRLDAIYVTINGSGEVALDALRAGMVDATVNGSGAVDVGNARSISATVNGSGAVYYAGNPEIIEQVVHGSGRIRRR